MPEVIGSEAVREALIAAVLRLLDRRSLADISVRDIAAEAGVNHGLVHRHFGSKDALVREAIRRTNERIRSEHPALGQTRWTAALLRNRPEIARILARCCLDGPRDLLPLAAPPPDVLETYVAPVRAAMARLGLGDADDAYVINAAGCAALLGWVILRPLFESGWGLPADTDERFARIAAILDRLLDG